jgi:hypothetical protein
VFPNEQPREGADGTLQGAWVGVMLTRAVTPEAVARFEELLAYYCDFRVVTDPSSMALVAGDESDDNDEGGDAGSRALAVPAAGWGAKVGGALETGAAYVASGLKVGAEYGGTLIHR